MFTQGVKTDVNTRIGPNSIGSYQQGDVTRHVTPGVIHGLDACRCEEPMKWVYKMKPPCCGDVIGFGGGLFESSAAGRRPAKLLVYLYKLKYVLSLRLSGRGLAEPVTP